METRFLKVKGINQDFNFHMTECHFFTSFTDDIEWVRMNYARDYYWVNEKDFNTDVPIPNERPSDKELYSDGGWEKYWNWHLSKLINDYENGILLENVLDEDFAGENIFIFDFNGKNVYIASNNDNIDDFIYEDVTKEFAQKIIDEINPTEIEEFVKTHTQEEVEKKYAVLGCEIEMWTL